MEWITNPEIWIAFLSLSVLEIVLGIDNIIFISILTNKLPIEQQPRAWRIGLGLALILRILLLFSITWVMQMTNDLFIIFDVGISLRDIILLLGGLFLIYKSVREVHDKMEIGGGDNVSVKAASTFTSIIIQILIMDIIFSLDSVITAVGMAEELGVMVAAVVVAMIIMLIAARTISDFVNENPAVKILALSFLIMIGSALIAEGLDFHIPKGYIYFAMAFAVLVEFVNIKIGTRKKLSS